MTVDQTSTNANGLPTLNRPCPPWCELKPGHGWDSGIEGVDDSRGHGLTLGKVPGGGSAGFGGHACVSIYSVETSPRGGPSTFSPVTIEVDGGDSLTTGQARQLAALLVLAADRVEAL